MSKVLSQTCRACLFPLNATTNVPISEEYQSNSTLSFMISETIHILLDPSDGLGENVCKFCADKIYHFYEFRQMFLESEKKLRDHLEQLKRDENYQNQLFSGQNHLNHGNEHNSNGSGVCDMDDDLNNPTVDASNNLRWKCGKCSKAFGRRIELQLHRHIHRTEAKPTVVTFDTDEPNGLGFYAEEMHIKTEPDAYDSENLDETLQSHFMDISTNSLPSNGNDELRWTCNTCKAQFLRRAHLRAHRQQHTDQQRKHHYTNVKRVNFKRQNHIPQTTMQKLFKSEIISANAKAGVIANAIKFENNGKSSIAKITTATATTTTTNGLSDDRWMCKKCFIPFRTRRLLRDHNLIHRSSGINSSMNSTAESSLLDDLLDIKAATIVAEKKTPPTPKKTPIKSTSTTTTTTTTTITGGPFKCHKCRKTFDTHKSLRRHKMFSHTFEIKLNLKSAPKHISNAMKKIPNEIMNKKKSMNRSPYVEREWACTSCSCVFGRRQLLREHRRTEHMLKPNVLPLSHEQNAVKEEQSAVDENVLSSTSIIE